LSLQDVEKKVLASAEAEARQLLEKAQAEAQAERERRGSALRDDQQRRLAAAIAQVDADLERELSMRRAEDGMKILQAKNEILGTIFQRAVERMLKSEGFDYGAWLAQQVRQAVGAGAGILHCNARDRAAVAAVLAESGTSQVTLADEPAPVKGGALLVGESADLDMTLESALADLRQEMSVSLAERLFAAVPVLGGPDPGE
jgi:vacuolar-type H+-ATPase subunit E/Vma4